MHRAWIGLIVACAALWPLVSRAQPTVATRVGPLPSERAPLRIGLIADAQYCDCPADKGRFYRISAEKLAQAVDSFNAMDLDLVINLGDLIDQHLGSYPRVLRILDGLEAPLYNVLGNHEFWQVPFHSQAGVLDSLGLAGGYCDLRHPGWRLLLLDGTELAEYAQGAHRDLSDEAEACRESIARQGNAALWNGAIGQAQMAWIDWQLGEAERAGERVLLFCHFPVTPPDHPMTLWNDADLRVLLARHRSAEAWVAGHSHDRGYERRDSVHHLTLTGMLMGPDSNAFAVLNVAEDRLVVEGFGREAYRVLPLRGSAAAPETILPERVERPDALPPSEPGCMLRLTLDVMGRLQSTEETESGTAPMTARLRPGYYGLLEYEEGQMRVKRLAILPKSEH